MCILLVFSFVFYGSIGIAKQVFSNLDCKAETLGQFGQRSMLECVIKTPKDTVIRVVTWKIDGRPLLVFNEGKLTKPQPGYSFADPSWNATNMNVSLLIDNTTVKHEGKYECMVMTDSGDGDGSISLKVTAKYSKPTIRSDAKAKPQTYVTLTCDSDGGFPEGELRWFDKHEKEQTATQVQPRKTESGLFHLSSQLTLGKSSASSKYTCRVFNAGGGREEENQFEVPDEPFFGGQADKGKQKELDLTTKIAAPVVVIGSLIVGLLMALLFYRRRSQQSRRHSLNGDHHIVGTCESEADKDDVGRMEETHQEDLA